MELARQASRLTPDTMHPAQWMGLQLALVNYYVDLDLGDDAQRTLAAIRIPAEHTGGMFLPWYHLSCALLAFHTGRWDDALAEIEAGLDRGEQFAMSRALRAVAALIAVHSGQTPPRRSTPDRRRPRLRQQNGRLVLRVSAAVRRRPSGRSPGRCRARLLPARRRHSTAASAICRAS